MDFTPKIRQALEKATGLFYIIALRFIQITMRSIANSRDMINFELHPCRGIVPFVSTTEYQIGYEVKGRGLSCTANPAEHSIMQGICGVSNWNHLGQIF